MSEPFIVGRRAYPRRAVVAYRVQSVATTFLGVPEYKIHEELACGHVGAAYYSQDDPRVHPLGRPGFRRCPDCATPEQEARAREDAAQWGHG